MLVDLGLGLGLAVLVLVLAPGLAIVGLLLALTGASLACRALYRRIRGRGEPAEPRVVATLHDRGHSPRRGY